MKKDFLNTYYLTRIISDLLIVFFFLKPSYLSFHQGQAHYSRNTNYMCVWGGGGALGGCSSGANTTSM